MGLYPLPTLAEKAQMKKTLARGPIFSRDYYEYWVKHLRIDGIKMEH